MRANKNWTSNSKGGEGVPERSGGMEPEGVTLNSAVFAQQKWPVKNLLIDNF